MIVDRGLKMKENSFIKEFTDYELAKLVRDIEKEQKERYSIVRVFITMGCSAKELVASLKIMSNAWNKIGNHNKKD